MLDPYADSVSRLVIYWALACSGLCWAVVPLAMAVRDVTVSYCRVVISRGGRSVAANWSGKLKAMTQAVGAVLLLLAPRWAACCGTWLTPPVSALVLIVTLASIGQYAWAARQARRGGGATVG